MLRAASVLHSLSRNSGGLFYTVRELNRAISSFNVENQVFGLRDDRLDEDIAAWAPLPVHASRCLGPRRFGYSTGLKRMLDIFNPNLLHLHGIWQHPGIVGSHWAQRNRRPFLISAHGMLDQWAVSNQRWKKALASWLFEARNLRRASCLRALNEAELGAFRAFGLKNPVCVIPNGIEILPYEAAPRAHGRKRLLYLGRLHPKKGLSTLLYAWTRLRGDFPDWQLDITGWSELGYKEELQTQAATLALGDSVVFCDSLYGKEKQDSMASADAFVLPSLSEGLPTVVLEAWSYSVPAVMTPACNLPEGFAARAAVRIDPTVPGIEAGLRTMLSMSSPERTDMGRRGLRLVRRKFSWREIGIDMVEVYHWLLGGGPVPACVDLQRV